MQSTRGSHPRDDINPAETSGIEAALEAAIARLDKYHPLSYRRRAAVECG